ncbi:hypothetical protein PG996_008929 [Apiospora saccharicola]|uniref:Uncharacterized protein n=1 Tax=Apiospora saccharicola TaxID=335842 RepID=A0ABR1UZC2_9PEZI
MPGSSGSRSGGSGGSSSGRGGSSSSSTGTYTGGSIIGGGNGNGGHGGQAHGAKWYVVRLVPLFVALVVTYAVVYWIRHQCRKRRQLQREGKIDPWIPVKRWLRWHDLHKQGSDEESPKDLERGTLASNNSSREASHDGQGLVSLPEKPMPAYQPDAHKGEFERDPNPQSILNI